MIKLLDILNEIKITPNNSYIEARKWPKSNDSYSLIFGEISFPVYKSGNFYFYNFDQNKPIEILPYLYLLKIKYKKENRGYIVIPEKYIKII